MQADERLGSIYTPNGLLSDEIAAHYT